MEIYFVRHGDVLPFETDPEEALSLKGKEKIALVGKGLKKMGISFDIVLTSPKKRALQTALIIAEETNYPRDKVKKTERLQALADPNEAIAYISSFINCHRILIAGHLPSLLSISAILLGSHAEEIMEIAKGSCFRIDVVTLPTDKGLLKWHLLPEQFKLMK